MLSRSYAVLGRDQESIAALKTALEYFPDKLELRLALAQGLLAQGGGLGADGDNTPIDVDAVRAFEAVLDLHENHPLALFVLGESARREGASSAARDYWSRLLAIMPPDTPESARMAEMIESLPGDQPPAIGGDAPGRPPRRFGRKYRYLTKKQEIRHQFNTPNHLKTLLFLYFCRVIAGCCDLDHRVPRDVKVSPNCQNGVGPDWRKGRRKCLASLELSS